MNDFQDLLKMFVEADAKKNRAISPRHDVDSKGRNVTVSPERGVGQGDQYVGLRGAGGAGLKRPDTDVPSEIPGEIAKGIRSFSGAGVPDMWGDETDDALRIKGFGEFIDKKDDPIEAIHEWAVGNAKEWNALKSRIYTTLRVMKELYSKLSEYTSSKGTIGQIAPPPNAAELSSMQAQYNAMRDKYLALKNPTGGTTP